MAEPMGTPTGGTEPTHAPAGGAEPTPGAGTEPNGGTEPKKSEVKTYTQEEFQAETEKLIAKAVAEAQGKWNTDFEVKLKEETEKAAQRAKMSAEERAKAEFDEQVKNFNDEKAKYDAERLEFDCTKQLAANSLPVEFSKMLTGTTAEETKTNIENFKTAFTKAVEAAVEEKLKGKTPETGGGGTPSAEDPFLAGFGN